MLRSAFHGKSADEVEAVFAEQSQKAEELSGNSTARLEFIERLIAKAGGEIDDDLRNEYEEALALKDAMLAAQEAERSKLLGLPDIEASGFEARLGYAQAIHEEIETARERELTTLRVRALGGAGTRLALEAGESTDLVATPEQLDAITLPAYYEPQAEKVLELAKEREAIVEKRLANLITELPEEDLQQSFQQTLIIGARTQSGYIKWVACTFDDPDPNAEQKVSVDPIHEESRNQLREERYPQIIKNGCGILIFEYLSQIDYEDQVITAMSKYASRFTEVD
jgi:hypothetical protein